MISGDSFTFERSQRAQQLFLRTRPDDRRGDRRLVQEPRERDVGGTFADLGAQRLPRFELGAIGLDLAAHVLLVAAALGHLLQRAGEQATRERAVADQPHAVLLDGGDHLEFDRACGEVVERLLGGQAQGVAVAARSRCHARCAIRRSSTSRRRGSCPRASAAPSPPRSRPTRPSGRCAASGTGRCSRCAGVGARPHRPDGSRAWTAGTRWASRPSGRTPWWRARPSRAGRRPWPPTCR